MSLRASVSKRITPLYCMYWCFKNNIPISAYASAPELMATMEEHKPVQRRFCGLRAVFVGIKCMYPAQYNHPMYLWPRTDQWAASMMLAAVLQAYMAYRTYRRLDIMGMMYSVGAPKKLWVRNAQNLVAWCTGLISVWYLFPQFGRFLPMNVAKYGDLRSKIRDLEIAKPSTLAVGHSHPDAANTRNKSDDAINNFIALNGFEAYSIQLSKRDVDRGIAGSLKHIWPIDKHTPPRSDVISERSMFKLINVDYYVDWTHYLWMMQPFMLFTFTPTEPCGVYQETKWTVNSDNVFTMDVCGGATYSHKIWNYNVDYCTAIYPGFTAVYGIESKRLNDHWSIVILVPRSVSANDSIAAPSCDLKRIEPVIWTETLATKKLGLRGCYVANVKRSDASIAIANLGTYSSCVLTAKTQAVIYARAQVNKLEVHDLTPVLASDFPDTDEKKNNLKHATALVYTAFPLLDIPTSNTVSKYAAADLAVSYRHLGGQQSLVLDEKLSCVVVSPPVLDSGYVPTKCKANELWTVQERITKTHNPQQSLPVKYSRYAVEFLELLIPVPGVLGPVDITRVEQLQDRPTQRLNHAKATPGLAAYYENIEVQVKSFQKSEAYGACKDPRNISTLPIEFILLYSTFTLPFSDLLKEQPWYAFGKHPNRVADRVHLLASKYKTFMETDFSRFDGTHSKALYDFELAALLRAFPTGYHGIIRKLQQAQATAKARTTLGVVYDVDGSRLSGSADTSCMNTLDNAFFAYCCYREDQRSISEAWSMLGIYGGDDGISPDAKKDISERVADEWKLRLKALIKSTVEMASVLGRVYPSPAAGPFHMADLPRQLSKLHITTSRDVRVVNDPMIALYNKATGHQVTDSSTPVLGAWCRMVNRIIKAGSMVEIKDLQSWSAKEYGVLDAEGKVDYTVPQSMAVATAAAMLGLTSEDIYNYEAHLQYITDLKQLQPIKFVEREIVDNVMIGSVAGNVNITNLLAAPDVKRNRDEKKPLQPDEGKHDTPAPKPCLKCKKTFVVTAEVLVKTKGKMPALCKQCAYLNRKSLLKGGTHRPPYARGRQ